MKAPSILSFAQYQQEMIKYCFQNELPAVEPVRIEYMPFYDRFSLVLFMHPGGWHFDCWLSKDDISKRNIYEILKPVIKELKDYLNPLWC